jgi:hypothetical protein
MGKCFDCGEAGAEVTAGAVGGFLAGAGVCAHVEEQALATIMTTPNKTDRARKGMRLDKSPGLRIPRRGRAAQMAISADNL